MFNKLVVLGITLLAAFQLQAQQLITPSDAFSRKKTTYVTLTDGTEIAGVIKDIDRKKGLFEEIKILDGNGKKHKLKAEEIQSMYIMPSNLAKLARSMDALTNVAKWNDETLNTELFDKGYVYFEQANVLVKKKQRTLLLQLLNPDFSKAVKVYHDPLAKESASLGVGGITVAGGQEKSYYVAKGDQPAFRLKKKDYRHEFKPFFQSCTSLLEKYDYPEWDKLVQHILEFSECQTN